jgi:hypothetical protein
MSGTPANCKEYAETKPLGTDFLEGLSKDATRKILLVVDTAVCVAPRRLRTGCRGRKAG